MTKYDYFFIAGLLLWFAETAYFGWNKTPQSTPEEFFDQVALILVGIGAIGTIVRSAAAKINITINGNADVKMD